VFAVIGVLTIVALSLAIVAAAVLGEEAARPRRVIPQAILGTVIVATVYFVFVAWAQAVGFGVTGASAWAADPTALATLSDRYVAHAVRDGPGPGHPPGLRGDHPAVQEPVRRDRGVGPADAGARRQARQALRRGDLLRADGQLDIVLPVIAVAVCGYTIYASIVPRPPAPISYSLWIALGFLVAGILIVGALVFRWPQRVRAFGRAFEAGGH
jgi:amino acid transporter